MEEKLKQGDQVPGHVGVLIGVDASGNEVALQAQNLDRPFWGFFVSMTGYPKCRCEILPAGEFKQKYPAVEAR
jgi:hypothetical protein